MQKNKNKKLKIKIYVKYIRNMEIFVLIHSETVLYKYKKWNKYFLINK